MALLFQIRASYTPPTMYGKTAHSHLNKDVVSDMGKRHAVPDGIRMPEGSEPIWNFVMGARAYSDWSPTDLILAARAVRYEVLIQQAYERLDTMLADGADFCDSESYCNDFVKNLMSIEKHQTSCLRALGLTKVAMKQETVTKKASAQAEATAALDYLNDSAFGSAIALPEHPN